MHGGVTTGTHSTNKVECVVQNGGNKKTDTKRTRRRGRRATPTNKWEKRKKRQHKRNTQKTHNGEREHGGEKHETHEISQGQIAETTNNTSRRNKIKESERER